MSIDEITEKIIESKNNDIAKAFTMHIGSLLINNGIVPIMTEYTRNDYENITDTNEYKLVMEYGISFKELDCSKHDNEIYKKAIDDFVQKVKEHTDDILDDLEDLDDEDIFEDEAFSDPSSEEEEKEPDSLSECMKEAGESITECAEEIKETVKEAVKESVEKAAEKVDDIGKEFTEE